MGTGISNCPVFTPQRATRNPNPGARNQYTIGYPQSMTQRQAISTR
ncbi:MAG: hypothetical protein P8X85_08530 [Desulfobacterales bacterium]